MLHRSVEPGPPAGWFLAGLERAAPRRFDRARRNGDVRRADPSGSHGARAGARRQPESPGTCWDA